MPISTDAHTKTPLTTQLKFPPDQNRNLWQKPMVSIQLKSSRKVAVALDFISVIESMHTDWSSLAWTISSLTAAIPNMTRFGPLTFSL